MSATDAELAAAKLFQNRMHQIFLGLAEDAFDIGADPTLTQGPLGPLVGDAHEAFGRALLEWLPGSLAGPGRDTASGGCGGSP